MTEATAPAKSPQQHFAELRTWVIEHCGTGHPVRQASYAMSLTANIHRMIKYGPDETLNHLTSRDLMNLLIYTNGLIAEWLMRTAFTRALIEDDRDVYDRLANSPFIPECSLWYYKLIESIIGVAKNPEESTEWLENMPPEEKSLARLLIARVYPDTAHVDWLHDVPENCPAIAYQLAEICATKKDCKHAAEEWVRQRPNVRNQAFA